MLGADDDVLDISVRANLDFTFRAQTSTPLQFRLSLNSVRWSSNLGWKLCGQ